ncbi:MAG: hypothetical protein OEM62_08570 [Acidobacteriota bacterium]|nr:hypothetical protein [Acidobacteriota bacterium]
MSTSTHRTLLCLTLFLMLLPLAVSSPGMPPTLKADEPAYYLMALSFFHDGDIVCEPQDLRRLFDRFPHVPVENLILLSDDGWVTTKFGKPFLYSLLTAPFAGWFGDRGMISFNLALVAIMIWMGASYLRRWNPDGESALFSGGFFLLGPSFVYAFWLQPEVFNMFSVAASAYLALTEARPADGAGLGARFLAALRHPDLRSAASGAVLAIAVYNKPMLALLGVPIVLIVLRHRGLRAALTWVLAAIIAMAAIAGTSTLLTGHPTPYLGAARGGVKVEDPEKLDELVAPFRRSARADRESLNSFRWMFRIPELRPRLLGENAGYFLWGRHTGVLLYMPFAVLATCLFLVNDRRSLDRWLLVAGLAAIAVFLLLWIFFNWHGGAGFVGNRYYANVYPAFLLLVTRLRPRWIVPAGFAAATLLVGPALVTPYGAPVPEPTLQAHARGPIHQLFPLEVSIRSKVPGYDVLTRHGMTFHGRRDLFRAADRGRGIIWVRGAETTEITILSPKPASTLRLEVQSLAARNTVRIDSGGDARELSFVADKSPPPSQIVEMALGPAKRKSDQLGKLLFVYELSVHCVTGRNPRRPDGQFLEPQFYLGASLTVLDPEARP